MKGGSASSGSKSEKANVWKLSWYAIRKANIGLSKLDNLVDATQEERDIIEGQLYFFRGFFHYMLMEWWGGMPYIDYAISPSETPTNPRETWQECAVKCAADLEKAARLLPVDWDQTAVGKTTLGNNNMRANKIMALAYKGKVLLWAGSPLMNWDSHDCWPWNMNTDFRPQTIISAGIKCWPTANYSNYFGMANGYPINDSSVKDAESGYDPSYPWADRDPRFYKTYIIDGETVGTNKKTNVSLYTGGAEREGANPQKGCYTGLMNAKLCLKKVDNDNCRDEYACVLSLMRLADLYLLYSEATVVGYGVRQTAPTFTKTALDAINVVRLTLPCSTSWARRSTTTTRVS